MLLDTLPFLALTKARGPMSHYTPVSVLSGFDSVDLADVTYRCWRTFVKLANGSLSFRKFVGCPYKLCQLR